jgi:hypothetical protein
MRAIRISFSTAVLAGCAGHAAVIPAQTQLGNASQASVPAVRLIVPGDLLVSTRQNYVNVYSSPEKGWSEVTSITKNVNGPVALAVDPRSGDIFVANRDSNSITVYSPETGDYVASITDGIANPTALAVDSKSDLAVVNGHAGNVTIYKNARLLSHTIGGVRGFAHLAFDSNDDLYVSDYITEDIKEYAPRTYKLIRTLSRGISKPDAIALDSLQTLFVANSKNNTVTAYGALGHDPILTISSGGTFPDSLATLGSQRVYVLNTLSDNVLNYDLIDGKSTTINFRKGDSPKAIVVQPPGYLCAAISVGVAIYAKNDGLVETIINGQRSTALAVER